MKEALVVMAKAPLAGQVKTRLIGGTLNGLPQPFNAEDAANLAAAFLSDTFAILEDVVEGRESVALVLCYTPAGAEEAFEKVEREGSLMLAQRGDSLGERLINCFNDLLGLGYESVVVMGGDSPTVPGEILLHALESLDDAQTVVLGATEDGGYYLIGARQLHPALFDGIAWSTPQVLAQTRERIAQAKLMPIELPPWYDVDTLDELARLQGEIEEDKEIGYYTRRCLKAIARRMREAQG